MPTPEQIQAARQYYSDAEIQDYLGQLGGEQQTARSEYAKGGTSPTFPASVVEPPPEIPDRPMSWEDIRKGGGAPFVDRLMASFKSTPQERLSMYKKRMGDENVMTSPGGEIMFKKDGDWKSVEGQGLEMGDIADVAGDVPEIAAMMLAGGAGGFGKQIGKAGFGAMLGNAFKQAIGAMLPGESDRGLMSRVGEIMRAGLGGSAAQGIAGPAAGGKTPVGSIKDLGNELTNAYLGARAKKLGTTEITKEGQMLEDATGFPLNLAEKTQDPWAKMILGFAYRNAYGQELAALDTKAKDVAALSFFKRMSGRLGQAGGFTRGEFADAAARAGTESVRDIETSLQKASKENYGFLGRPEAVTADIPLTNRNNLLESTARYQESLGTPDGIAAARELRTMMAAPGGDSMRPMGNVRLLQQQLQEFGEEGFSKQTEKLYRNLKTAENTYLPKALWAATRQDLGEAAKGGNVQAQKLLDARTKTEELLSLRERLKEVPPIKFMESKGMLNKALSNEGFVGQEAIQGHLMEGIRTGKIQPSEIANMTKLMQAVNPNFVHDFARSVIDQAVAAGKAAGRDRPSGFSYDAAAKSLPSPDYLQAMYKDIWDKGAQTTGLKVHHDISLLLRAVDRAQKVGQGIPHSPAETAMSILEKVANLQFGSATKQFGTQYLSPKIVGNLAMPQAARAKAALEIGGTATPKAAPSFLRDYVLNSLPRVLPAATYEAASSMPRSNRPEIGQ